MIGCLCELFVTETAYELAQSIVHRPGVAVWHANAAYALHVEHNGQTWTPNWWDRHYLHSAIQHMKAQRARTAQRKVIDAVTRTTH